MTLSPRPTLHDLVRIAADEGFAPDAVRLVLRGGDGALEELTVAETRGDGTTGRVIVLVTLREVLEEADRLGSDYHAVPGES